MPSVLFIFWKTGFRITAEYFCAWVPLVWAQPHQLRSQLVCAFLAEMIPCCQLLAVHSRYTIFGFFRLLQGLGERPGLCKYYVSLDAVFLSRR